MTSSPWFSTSRTRKFALRYALFVAFVCIGAPAAFAQTAQFGGVQIAVASGFFQPVGVAVDSSGNLYVVDADTFNIDEILAVNGVIPASPTIRVLLHDSSANPSAVAVDQAGNVYYTNLDTGSNLQNNTVKEILAVNGTIPPSPGVIQLGSGLFYPNGIAVDSSGNVYVADTDHSLVKEMLAVNGSVPTSPTIISLGSGFLSPNAVAVDGNGNVYVADKGNHAVKEILAVNGVIPASPVINTLASGYCAPTYVSLDSNNNLYFSDYCNDAVYEIFAVNGTIPSAPAVRQIASIEQPTALAINSAGNIFVGGYYNTIPEILATGSNFEEVNVGASTSALPLSFYFTAPGTLGSTAVVTQGAVGLDFADAGTGSCIPGTSYRPNQTCTVNVTFTPRFAGTRVGAVVLKNTSGAVFATGYVQGTGVGPQINFSPGTESTVLSNVGLSYPSNIAVDAAGNFYIMDNNNARVVKASLSAGSYTLTTVATGLLGAYGVAIDAAGTVYVGDTGNQRVLKETPTATGYAQSVVDSGFGYPMGIAVDAIGNVYVADQSNGRILKETPSSTGYTESTVVASLSYPNGVAVDGSGNLYIADTDNLRVLKETLTASGYLQSVLPVSAQVSANSIAVDGLGNVYFEDALTDNVFEERLTPNGYVESTIVSDLHIPAGPFGVAVDGSGNVYVVYSSQNSIVKADFADAPSLTFASTAVGATSSDSPQTVTLENIGNADLTLPIPATGNNPSIAPGFSLNSNAPSACPVTGSGASTPGAVPAGTACELAISFSPTTAGSITGSLTLSDNNLNATAPSYATQSIALNGSAQPATPTITWPTPAPIIYGAALSATQLDATASVPGTFSYSPSAGTILTAGSQTVTATFTPTDTTDYTTATASVILTVNKATPVITWPTPAPITYGTALSSKQLDATASVAGTFAYTPAAGSVPPVGTDTLAVVFTPTDTTDYNSTGASVNLSVKPAPGFTLSSSAASLSVKQGNSTSTTISVADVGGFTGKVSLSASGLPSGVSASFSKNPTTASSMLTLSAGSKAALGTNTITITGTSGSLRQTTTVTLTVTARK